MARSLYGLCEVSVLCLGVIHAYTTLWTDEFKRTYKSNKFFATLTLFSEHISLKNVLCITIYLFDLALAKQIFLTKEYSTYHFHEM